MSYVIYNNEKLTIYRLCVLFFTGIKFRGVIDLVM